jgi:hypothetical protein
MHGYGEKLDLSPKTNLWGALIVVAAFAWVEEK